MSRNTERRLGSIAVAALLLSACRTAPPTSAATEASTKLFPDLPIGPGKFHPGMSIEEARSTFPGAKFKTYQDNTVLLTMNDPAPATREFHGSRNATSYIPEAVFVDGKISILLIVASYTGHDILSVDDFKILVRAFQADCEKAYGRPYDEILKKRYPHDTGKFNGQDYETAVWRDPDYTVELRKQVDGSGEE
jgi:hypothetical protein